MATATDTESPTTGEPAPQEFSQIWPRERRYWLVALILGLITAAEVTTYTHDDTWGDLATPSLLAMMAAKFFVVTWFFMHLRSDRKLLTVVFYFGLALAVAVYMAALAASGFFS